MLHTIPLSSLIHLVTGHLTSQFRHRPPPGICEEGTARRLPGRTSRKLWSPRPCRARTLGEGRGEGRPPPQGLHLLLWGLPSSPSLQGCLPHWADDPRCGGIAVTRLSRAPMGSMGQSRVHSKAWLGGWVWSGSHHSLGGCSAQLQQTPKPGPPTSQPLLNHRGGTWPLL